MYERWCEGGRGIYVAPLTPLSHLSYTSTAITSVISPLQPPHCRLERENIETRTEKYLRNKNIIKNISSQPPWSAGSSVRSGAGTSQVKPGHRGGNFGNTVTSLVSGDSLGLCWGFVWLMVPGNWSKIKLSSFWLNYQSTTFYR